MKKSLSLLSIIAVAAACNDAARTPTSPTSPSLSNGHAADDPYDLHGQPEPMMKGVHWARGAQPARVSRSVNMTWHGGAIMPSSVTYTIFWGSSWNNATYAGDKITGLASFYSGFGGSNYAAASTEYSGTNGQVTSSSQFMTSSYIDGAAAPSGAPSVAAVQAEVCKVLQSQGQTPRSDALYAVYATTRRGSAGYCAWHSYGSCSDGTPIQFAWFFDLAGDSGCDPQDVSSGHSQALAALANVSAHELSETITDPRNGGWYDSQNQENGDKCAWAFPSGLATLSNGSTWKLQMEWSNAAFSAGTGLPNRSGQKGCLPGT